jgi:GNAT superfamily N-acetyltransferase
MNAIRPATEQDAGAIAHVHIESWRSTYKGIVPDAYLAALDEPARTAQWREWIGSEAPVFVAIQDGGVVGFIGGGAIRDLIEGYDAELFAIYLLQSHQRRGIGTALLRRLATHLHHAGFTSLAVWVLEENVSSTFYERSGALRIARKQIEIGGVSLSVVAYGWPSLQAIFLQEHT